MTAPPRPPAHRAPTFESVPALRGAPPPQARLRARAIAVAVLAAAGSFGRAAQADSLRVALIRPNTNEPATREALTRIQGELAAEGFEVVTVEAPPKDDSSPARGLDATLLASIEFAVDPDARAAELRVVDRLTNKTLIRRVTIDAAEAPRFVEIVAVRAVELLRASLVELLLRAHPPPAAAVPPATMKHAIEHATTWVAKAVELRRQSQWGFDAGVAALGGFEGISPTVVGVLRFRAAVGPSFQIRVTAAGLGPPAHVDSRNGKASINQGLGLLEGVWTPWVERTLHPVVSLGAGPMYVSVDGQTSLPFPFVGAQSSGLSLALDAGAGGEVRLSSHFDVSLEIHAFLTRPYQVVRFLDQDAAQVSQPTLLGTLTLVGWL